MNGFSSATPDTRAGAPDDAVLLLVLLASIMSLLGKAPSLPRLHDCQRWRPLVLRSSTLRPEVGRSRFLVSERERERERANVFRLPFQTPLLVCGTSLQRGDGKNAHVGFIGRYVVVYH